MSQEQNICLLYVFLLVNNNLLYMVYRGVIYVYYALLYVGYNYVGYNILTASSAAAHAGWSLNHWRWYCVGLGIQCVVRMYIPYDA